MNIFKIIANNQIKACLFFIILAYLCFGAGCVSNKAGEAEFIPNPNARFTPALNVKVVNKYGSSDEIELCEIVFSKTRDMQTPFKRFRLYKNTEFSLEGFNGGDEFYIGAFIDLDSNLSPTFGKEPVGGAYAENAISLCQSPEVNFNERKKESEFKIVIKKDVITTVELKMLRPVNGRTPSNGALGLTTLPDFAWKRPEGIRTCKITVYNEETADAYWQAVTSSDKIKYSILTDNNDYNLMPAKLLPANLRHKWSLTGYDANNEIWAYAPGFSFLP